MKIAFIKDTKLNRKQYKTGDKLKVSDAIAARLVSERMAVEDKTTAEAPKKESKKKSEEK